MSIFEKFKIGFKKSAQNISSGFREILIKKEIDDNSLNKIEEFLISSDVGIDAASEIRNILAQEKIDPGSDLIGEINKVLKRYIVSTMGNFEKKDFFKNNNNLNESNSFSEKKGPSAPPQKLESSPPTVSDIGDIKKLNELISKNLRLGLTIKDSNIPKDLSDSRKPENLLMGLGIDTTRKFFKSNKYLDPIKENILNNFSKSKLLKKITKRVANLGLN